MTDETSPEEDNTVSSASLCMSPSMSERPEDRTTDEIDNMAPICASTPLVRLPRSLANGHDNTKDSDTLNGNDCVNIVSESTNSMDVLSGGESDAGDTLKRRNNNNSISSTLTNTLKDGTSDKKRGDVTYFVAKELLMTERTYKRDLELVTVTFSRRVSELAGSDVGSETSGDVSALARAALALEPLALPAGALLARLERTLAAASPARMQNEEEPEYKKIAELLYDYLSNTLDAYALYVSHAGALVALVESVRRGGGKAAALCAEFDTSAVLPLACLLLRPLHRLLHYARLAVELYKACGSEAAKSALEVSSRVASLARAQLPHAENHAALCQLQRDIVGYDKLLVAGREFIRLGCLYKHSTRGLQQRMLFLFSDVLVIASKPGGGSSHFRAHSALALYTLNLRIADHPNSFELNGEDIQLLFSASTEQEFLGWSRALEAAIQHARDNPADVDTELTHDGDSHDHCSSTLSVGSSGACAGSSLPHVCWHRVASLHRDHLQLALRSQLSGYLLRKFKKSPGWQKLWVVFAAFTLFFYKSWQDDTPLASLPLLGYGVCAPDAGDGIDKEFVFKLQFKNHVYYFRADSHFTYNRWTEVLQTAMVRNNHN